jgi:hypothetical protein
VRYTAGPSPHRCGLWEVRRDTLLLTEGTEAECSVSAWALNAVAEGDRLAYMSDSKNVGEPGVYGFYTGPTEGVAPTRPAAESKLESMKEIER